MGIRRAADQLHGHAHLFARFLHASFEHVFHPELLRDFRQVFRRTLVSLGRGARDHLQIGDLGQSRQDFILDAVGKIGVLRILASILEWQDGNRFFGRGACELFPGWFRSGKLNASKVAATIAVPTKKANFRLLHCGIGSSGDTFSVRFIPCGVISKAQATISAMGNPRATTITNLQHSPRRMERGQNRRRLDHQPATTA